MTKELVEIVRYPQGLAADILALEQNFGELHMLVRDVIIFLNKQTSKNLFGYVEFDVKTFADTMGYSAGNLQTTIKGLKKTEIDHLGHAWDSKIEQTLFLMLRNNFLLGGKYKGVFSMKSIQMLQYINVYNDPINKQKRLYEVKIDSYLFDSFFREYHIIDLNDYRHISVNLSNNKNKARLTNLYLFLVRAFYITSEKNRFYSTTVDDISMVLGLKFIEGNHRRRKQDVDRALKSLSTLNSIHFRYTFVPSSPNSRFKYTIAIEFIDDKSLDFDKDYTKFLVYVMNNLKQEYHNKDNEAALTRGVYVDFTTPSDKVFVDWFQNKELDAELKIKAIKESCKQIFREIDLQITDKIISNFYSADTLFELYNYLKKWEQTTIRKESERKLAIKKQLIKRK